MLQHQQLKRMPGIATENKATDIIADRRTFVAAKLMSPTRCNYIHTHTLVHI